MIRLILIHIFFGLFILSTQKSLSIEYISIDKFHSIHPEQKSIYKKFSKRVETKGVPVGKNLQSKLVKIVFIYPGQQVSDYWRRSIKSFKGRMDQIKIRYKISEFFSKPVVDYRTQEKQIKKALEESPDYLVFTLDVKKHQRIIERIITKDKPKIILQNITTPLKAWKGKHPFLYVGFDHEAGSRLIAKHYIKKTSGTGEYALLYFSQGYVSAMRGDTFVNYLKKKSKLKLISSYYTNGNRKKTKEATLNILKEYPNIKFIYACSTDVALGAIDALRISDRIGNVMINGWGGGSVELDMILKRQMDMTVMRINDDNGVAMAEAVRYDIEGKRDEVPLIYSGNFVLIKKGINTKKLHNLKKRAFRYSGN